MPKLTEALVLSRSRAACLDNVKKLNCWASKIEDISVVKDLENVEIVNLSCNVIRTLEPFRNCEQLRELYVRRNSIQSLSEIQHLKDLEYLKNLWLADNPCTECDHYRMTVIKTLPSLEKLDNQAITDDERELASKQGLDLDPPLSAASPGAPGGPGCSPEPDTADLNGESHGQGDPMLLSLEETNRLRVDLGLKPVTAKHGTPPSQAWTDTKQSAATPASNTLQAVLLLLDTLDVSELQRLQQVVSDKLLDQNRDDQMANDQNESEQGDDEVDTKLDDSAGKEPAEC